MNAPAHAAQVERFERGDIDAADFDHAAHVYTAWCYLERWPVSEAVARFDAALRRLTEKLGAKDKYHATITGFFLLLIAERRAAAPDDDWDAFREHNADLLAGSGALLAAHYSRARLSSTTARAQFLLPDRGAPQGASTIW